MKRTVHFCLNLSHPRIFQPIRSDQSFKKKHRRYFHIVPQREIATRRVIVSYRLLLESHDDPGKSE